jgi:16S rRNA (guanine1207-N2)-methyltransferase
MNESLPTPHGHFTLQRRPSVEGLRGWDAADEYLLEMAAQGPCPSRALIVNDSFGALACALHDAAPVSWSDSFTTHLASRENWQRNSITGAFTALPATETPQGPFELVLWRVPKSQALFEQQIARLHGVLDGTTRVLAGGMDKHLLPNTKALLARLGAVTTLPGKKKSHLFQLHPAPALSVPPPPRPLELSLPDFELTLRGDANVFAREKLDIGARFFIEQFARLPTAQRSADLGCGNGVLSLVLAKLRPGAEIHCFDESYQAVAAARDNWRRNIGGPQPEHFHLDDGLSHYRGDPFDLMLCNPPFHQQHAIGGHIARQLFAQSKRHLRQGGELWVVGNRHLDYAALLKRVFGNCKQVAANAKFVVLAAKNG